MPSNLQLVNFFGWTLGGFYLARYSNSPVGAFDEMVALAGLAWNFPTSCAWAARVYVNNKEARRHGISHVGLPSRFASFSAKPLVIRDPNSITVDTQKKKKKKKHKNWWLDDTHHHVDLEIRNEERNHLKVPVATMKVPPQKVSWAPRIHMNLPSYSGGTPDYPELVKYSLKLKANVKPVAPVTLEFNGHEDHSPTEELMHMVLGGKPLLCLSFDDMHMEVHAPTLWDRRNSTKRREKKITLL